LDELSRLRVATGAWFKDRYSAAQWSDDRGLPHDLDEMPISDHRRIVTAVLPWAPEAWWASKAAAETLHECLKSSFGYHASWVGTTGSKPFCLAGAYLLLLVAVAQRFPGRFGSLVKADWRPFLRDGKPISFLPVQYHKDAEQAVRALYEFYCLIRVKKLSGDKAPKPQEDALGIEDVELPQDPGANFRVKVPWEGKQIEDFGSEYSERIRGGLSTEVLALPAAKATTALMRFILASQTRKSGVGPVGLIMLEDTGVWRIGRW
jgi:hypothetical protein